MAARAYQEQKAAEDNAPPAAVDDLEATLGVEAM